MAVDHNQILSTFGYQAIEESHQVVITTKPPYFFFAVLAIIVPFVVAFALIGSAEMLILLIPVLALPFIHDSWKFPSTVHFDSKEKLLSVSRPFFIKAQLAYNEIKDVSISVTSQYAGTSPFEEGNKDITYRIYLELGGDKVIRLLKIKSRKDISEDIKKLTDFVQNLINPTNGIFTDAYKPKP